MPFTETIEFRSDAYRQEVVTYSTEKLKVIEKVATRKALSSGFSTGSGVVTATFTGGLTLPIAAYKARSTYVAGRKLEITREELKRRGEALRDPKISDVLLGAGPAAVALGLGFDDIFGGLTGVEAVEDSLGLPDGSNQSTGLFESSSAVMDGFTGQAEQLVDHAIDGTPGSQQVLEAFQSADPLAYHAGMVQANVIEAQIAGEAVEILLTQPVEEPPACKRSIQASFFWDLLQCDLCERRIEQGPYWHCCSCSDDGWDICTACYEADNRCRGTGHTMQRLQTPSGQAFIDLIAQKPEYATWKPSANTIASSADLLICARLVTETRSSAKPATPIVPVHRIANHVSASNANDLRIKEHSITVVLVKTSQALITTISAMDVTSSVCIVRSPQSIP
ncbi:hypothetical protein E8E14_014394 [Neopestalotiopsis sp. 37M]|nr:hypothetical protein E8E14_014394 [Neopestalotiopsis sp. 37M]